MAKFNGTIEELKSIITSLGYSIEHIDEGNMQKIKTAEGGIINWFQSTKTLQFQGNQQVKSTLEKQVLSAINNGQFPLSIIASTSSFQSNNSTPPWDTQSVPIKEKVFVVHGHDTVSKEQLELILHKLGLDPFVLANTGGSGLTIIEALEREIGNREGQAKFGIVLLTPDDMSYAKNSAPDSAEPRARQNVILEMGMLLSAIGRSNVAILKKGHLEVPSDAQGILYISYNDHVKETVPRLVDRLTNAGFKLDPAAITRASS